MMEFGTAVLMGRFQPYHLGHAGLLRKAFETAPNVVVVLGSSHAAPSTRNPFSAAEREAMVRSSLSTEENARIRFVAQRDVWDGERWAREVAAAVEATDSGRIALVGYHKDASSSYLDTFPTWTLIDTGRQGPLDATPLRERILSRASWHDVEAELGDKLPDPVLAWIAQWACGELRLELALDLESVVAYRARWGTGPFASADALVKACGHVLLIRRGKRPGAGLRALPGGFLEPSEPPEEGARRELAEETGLELGDLRATGQRLFDHPSRSERARIATHAFLFEPDWKNLPEVAGADDARDARWIPINDLPGLEAEFFEDHFHILRQLLG